MSYTAFLFRIPFGMNLAMATLTGSAIGADNVPLAKRMIKVNGIFVSAIFVLLLMTTICLKNQIVDFLTDDEEVATMVKGVIIVVFAFQLPDHLQGFLQGPIRGLGKLKNASYITLVSCYLIGLPTAYLLGFTFDFKVYGLQAGIGLAMYVQAISYFTLIVTSDF